MQLRISLIFLILLLKTGVSLAQNTDCGIERWGVKVLTDADTSSINFVPLQSSIHEQVSLPVVNPGTASVRLESEKQLYRLSGTIAFYKLEDDGDIHIVIYNGPDTMVAEIPNPDCPTSQGTSHIEQFRTAQQWISAFVGKPTTSFKTANVPVTITGIGYYDIPHGQKGLAPNHREIHPILTVDGQSEVKPVHNAPFSLFPNPSKTVVHVVGAIGEIRIIDLKGNVVIQSKGSEIDVSGLSSGAYYITDGKHRARFIK